MMTCLEGLALFAKKHQINLSLISVTRKDKLHSLSVVDSFDSIVTRRLYVCKVSLKFAAVWKISLIVVILRSIFVSIIINLALYRETALNANCNICCSLKITYYMNLIKT